MNCIKCGKEISRSDNGPELVGEMIEVIVEKQTPETIAYAKKQLGKYADENGECKLGICYECFIDNKIGR